MSRESANWIRVSIAIALLVSKSSGITHVARKGSVAKIDYVEKLNELIERGQDDDLNAEPLHRRAFEMYVESSTEVAATDLRQWPREWTEEKRDLLKDWLDENSTALAQLELAAEKPCYWFRYEGFSTFAIDEPDYLRRARKLFFALLIRAKLKAEQGDMEGAFADLFVAYRFCSDMKRRPLQGPQLAGMIGLEHTLIRGFEVLARAEVDTALLMILQKRLTELHRDQDFFIDLRGDELATMDVIQWVLSGYGLTEFVNEETSWQVSDFWWKYIPPEEMGALVSNYPQAELEHLVRKAYVHYETLISKTPFQWHAENIEWYEVMKELVAENLLLLYRTPDVRGTAEVGFRLRARRDAFATALALLRHRSERGVLPEKMQALVAAGYMSKLPMDPYSDRPLVYKRVEDNFVLYSVGPNMQDDGGERSDRNREGKPGDFVFWPVP